MKKATILFNKDRKEYNGLFKNTLNNLAKALNKDISIGIHHAEDLPINKQFSEDRLAILIWGSDKTDEMVFVDKETAFGYKFCNDALFIPSEGTIQFKDDELVLAEYNESNHVLSFLYDVWEYESYDEILLFEHIINMFIEHIFGSIEEYNKRIEEVIAREREESIKLAVKNIMSTIERDRRDLTNRIKDNKRAFEDYMNKIKNYSMTIMSLEAQLEGLNNGEEGIKEKIEKEIEAMKAHKKIENIFFSEKGNLILDTVELFARVKCYDDIVRTYRMGRYRIEVTLGNGRVRFFNRDLKNIRRSCWGACHHPHVNTNGEGCLGNASTLIAECIANREWAVLADVLINYLESINVNDSAGKNFSSWDEIDKDGNTITGDEKYTTDNTASEEANKKYQKEMREYVKSGNIYTVGIEY